MLEAPGVPHIYLPRAASLNSKGFYEVHIVQLCDCQSSWHPQIKSVTSHKMNQFIWRNCGNAAVAACSCLCKSKRELTSSAGAGCLFFWSLSLQLISGASLIKPFGETTQMVWRPRSDLWALPEAVLVYILPSALTDCFLFGFIPVYCGVNVSVVCHWQGNNKIPFIHQTSCDCCLYLLSLITTLVFSCSQLLSPLYLVNSRRGFDVTVKQHFEDIVPS